MGPGGGKNGASPLPPENNVLLVQGDLGSQNKNNLLCKGYSPGLFVLKDGPKSHCPIVSCFGCKIHFEFHSGSQIMGLSLPSESLSGHQVLVGVDDPPGF